LINEAKKKFKDDLRGCQLWAAFVLFLKS
jgi:hypothetical protein